MVQGFHPITHHAKHLKTHSTAGKLFDKTMYAIALIAPIMTIPQLLQVWVQRQTQGVSLDTWGAYAFVSGLWFVYGILHKDKIIILANILLLVLDSTIVIGVIFIH